MAKPKGQAARYTVLRSPVVHDGDVYEPGETIELAEADVQTLIAVSAIEAAPGKAKPEKTEPEKAEPEKT